MLSCLIEKYLHDIDVRDSPPMYLGQVVTACVPSPLHLGYALGAIRWLSIAVRSNIVAEVPTQARLEVVGVSGDVSLIGERVADEVLNAADTAKRRYGFGMG